MTFLVMLLSMNLMNNIKLAKELINKTNDMVKEEIKIMEVCGSHTNAIFKYGLRGLLSSKIKLLSGPGCPVCVTPKSHIDAGIELVNNYDITLATFGDIAKIKGSKDSIIDQRVKGREVIILYTPLDVLELAQNNTNKNIIFFALGFETTMPIIAMTIQLAKERNIKNLHFLISHKYINPALHKILSKDSHNLKGIIYPGHVAAIMGADNCSFIWEKYKIPSVVCGFEPLDIVGGVYYLANYWVSKKGSSANLYKTCVSNKGNLRAKRLIEEVFKTVDSEWRGIGVIEDSGCELKGEYQEFDALKKYGIEFAKNQSSNKDNCICGDILMGNKYPFECRYFQNQCTPLNPMGPCMVSMEGSCATFYRYKGEMISG